ncbi:MAG: hypothetical protein ACTSXD_13400 [Candidatus Heimdallarchaeaceae archaeon]
MIVAVIGKTGCGKSTYVENMNRGHKNTVYIYDDIPYLSKYNVNGKENVYVVDIDDLSDKKINSLINICRKLKIDLFLLTSNPKIKWKVDKKIFLSFRNLNLDERVKRLCEKTDGDVRKAMQILKYNSEYIHSIDEDIIKILKNHKEDTLKIYKEIFPYFDMRTQKFIIKLYQRNAERNHKLLEILNILNDDYTTKSKFKYYLLFMFLSKLPTNAIPSYSFKFSQNRKEEEIEWICKKYNISKRIAQKYSQLITVEKKSDNIMIDEDKVENEKEKCKSLFTF